MDVHEHSTIREGAVTGVIGAVIVALWYLIVDTAGREPLRTPNVLASGERFAPCR
jgi:hypothetical protein